jgi:chromosome segregation ATPase
MDALDRERLGALLERVREDEDDYNYEDEKKSMFAIRACVELMLEWDVENAWDKLNDVKEHLCDEDIEEWLEKEMEKINKQSLKDYIDALVRNNEEHKAEIKRLQEMVQTMRTALNERDDAHRQRTREVSDLEYKVTCLEHTLEAHKRRMADFKNETEQAGLRVKDLVQQNDQQGAKIRQLNADIAQVIADRAVLNDQKRQTAAVLEALQQRVKELDADNQHKGAAIALRDIQLHNMETELTQREKTIKELNCRCDNQELVIIERDKEIKELQERIHGLEHGNGMRGQD